MAVVTSHVPFVEGGHLIIAHATIRGLRECGYDADLILTTQNRFGRQFRAYLANRFTDVEVDGLGRKIHQVISFRFPSFAVKHPFHVCWLNHRLREYYDLWPALFSQLPLKGKIKEMVRRKIIHLVDTYLLKHNVTKLYAQSKTVQARLKKWGNITSEVLYPPPPQRKYRTDGYGDFILSVSRLQKLKRLDLIIDTFIHVKDKNLKAYILGDGPEFSRLSQKIKESQLENQVYLLGKADEETLLTYYANCLAVFFCPFNEDYGFVTGEAFASRKAVLTCFDSGGPAELVQDGQTGYVLPPEPKTIAEKIEELAANKRLAERMGEKAFQFISGITWEKTVKRLIIFK